jgi:hypothetical protein
MVEAALVGEVVPESAILAGHELIARLDRKKLKIRAALWLRGTDDPEWAMYLASSLLKKEGPRRLYVSIQAELRALPEHQQAGLTVGNIRLLPVDAPLLSTLRLVVTTPANAIGRVQLRRSIVNGELLPDCLIYRNT